jgi:serine/threonine protein kinase
MISGGQIPCALCWALATRRIGERAGQPASTLSTPGSETPGLGPAIGAPQDRPDVPDYELFSPPFGHGAYGKVWMVRNAVGQLQALKAVYLSNFKNNRDPYEREFSGIRRYKPVSDKHPGLLRVDFVSRMKSAGYFYYVMELGDAAEPGWERDLSKYQPRDLASEQQRSPGKKLPVRECVRIGRALAEALDFLHRQGLTHRDIKPRNIIFVNNQPKLADVGLMSEIHPPDREATSVGTPGYMPPAPEPPGTQQADIYALGMVLYVLSTGHSPAAFPEISTTLVNTHGIEDFFALNSVLVKACHPDRSQRYASAGEMSQALRDAQAKLG